MNVARVATVAACAPTTTEGSFEGLCLATAGLACIYRHPWSAVHLYEAVCGQFCGWFGGRLWRCHGGIRYVYNTCGRSWNEGWG